MKPRADKIIDRHDASDIFCDGVLGISMRQDVLRVTLHADRTDAGDGKSVNRVVIAHLSMPPGGFVDLYNQMSAAMKRLTKTGKVKDVENPPQQPA